MTTIAKQNQLGVMDFFYSKDILRRAVWNAFLELKFLSKSYFERNMTEAYRNVSDFKFIAELSAMKVCLEELEEKGKLEDFIVRYGLENYNKFLVLIVYLHEYSLKRASKEDDYTACENSKTLFHLITSIVRIVKQYDIDYEEVKENYFSEEFRSAQKRWRELDAKEIEENTEKIKQSKIDFENALEVFKREYHF